MCGVSVECVSECVGSAGMWGGEVSVCVCVCVGALACGCAVRVSFALWGAMGGFGGRGVGE